MRRWMIMPGTALGIALLAGCSVPKKAGFPEVGKSVEERTGNRIFWNQGGEADREVSRKIREMLAHPLSPAEAVQIALLNNPTLQATYEELTIAQADVVQAGLLQNPVFSGSVQFHLTGVGSAAWSVGVEQDFLSLLLIPARKRVAGAFFEAAKARVGSEVVNLAFDVRSAYYALQGAQQIAAMRQTILATAEAAVDLAQRQHEAGNISDLDLANEQGLYEQIRVDLARSQADILGTRERLSRLMGVWGPDAIWTVSAGLADLPVEDPPLEHAESLAIQQRLDVAAARQEAQARSYALAMATDWRLLGIASVGASVDHDPEGNMVVGPSARLELPIFDQKQAMIARLEAELRQSQARLAVLSVGARSEVRESRARVQLARGLVQYYRTTVIPLRERIVALSQQQYDAMLIGVYQLLIAKQNEVNAYREYIEAVRDYWIARADLDRAAGGRVGGPPAGAAAPASTPTPTATPPDASAMPAQGGAHQHHQETKP